MADLERTGATIDRRRELLRRRIAASGLAASETRHAPVCAGERYPLSPGQRRMWFLHALEEGHAGDATLNICVGYRLTGAVDEARLHAAFGDVVARHTILRTTYGVDSEGEPYQVFADDVEISWRTVDLTNIPDQQRDRQIEVIARAEFGRPFDLTTELPLRATLIRTAADDFALLLVIHHICWDDDSWAVFFDDLSAFYQGRKPSVPAAQFVALDASAQPGIADVGYWADTLRPSPEPLELPGFAGPNPSRRAERRSQAVPADLFGRVEDFARRHSASPFMVLLAAFGVLVRRYTGATDFVISVPVTDRDAGAEGAIGYFGNTLLLRITPRTRDTFSSFVDAVRETCLAGFAHQSVGIDRVVREVNPERMGHDGMDQLVRLGFSMRKSAAGLALDGVAVRQLGLGAVAAHVPLALAVVLDPDGVYTEFEYQTDVLAGELVEQMLAHYLQLLDNALAEAGRRLTSLDMLGTGERDTVLAQSHGPIVATPPTTMVALLEAAAVLRARVAPDAVALVSDEVELTYAGLHRRANRLARWLIEQGYGPDDVIGLRMTASIEFIVAVLAVLKAGAAYLPIDPAHPDERIQYIVMDAQPRTVLGRQEFDVAERAAAELADTTVSDVERVCPLQPGNLAYVIYTSGSTGRPKGVAVAHHAIAEHVEGNIAEWNMTADERVLQSSSVSFDASLFDIFVTLSAGAQLVVPKPLEGGVFTDIGYIAGLISRHRITVLHMVPAMLNTVLLLPQVREWRALRRVPVGGEALAGEVADKFAGHFDAQLSNHYGPTEAVVGATHMLVSGRQGARVVPIGVPNRNVYTYVLDEQLQPVPAEVIGELYLGGNQLARGYLGRPGLTAERFVADPFNPGTRLYRTGDLVRRNISGDLEFIGRADEQVKIRGFRVELGEIESAIATHPAVRHCLVVAEDTVGGPVLAAYLVLVAEVVSFDLTEIRAHAAAKLPEYMVPNAFALIPEIPLTVNGKLDKRALPAPTPVAARDHREPATPTERRMCSIFARLFGSEQVGAEDSFFGLGGHSLLAARLVAQIRAEFGVELSVRTVFDMPTPAGLAARLVEKFRAEFDFYLDEDLDFELDEDLDETDFADPSDDLSGALSRRPELAGSPRPERLPLSYSQLATWFQYRIEGARDAFNLPLTLRFTGRLDIAALTGALNDVVARHEPLRTNFAEHEGVPYQIVHPALTVELAVTEIPAGRLDETVAQLRRHVFTPESGPLIRATLLALDPDTHVLVVIVHHIVSDHASLGIFFEDLLVAYRGRVDGHPPQWPTLPVQYADYALWQQNAFGRASEWGQAELAYWREALAGLPDEISVAHDHVRPPVLGKRGEAVSFTVSAPRRAALAQLAEQNGATEFQVCQAVLAVLLHKLGGGTDIPIGSPVAARDESAESLIGLFANLVVLRNDLSGDPTLGAMVARSRDTVLDAFAHQELPIERLVEHLNPPRSLSRNPLFQNIIHFFGPDWASRPHDLGTGDLWPPDTTVVPLPVDQDLALIDLHLGVNATTDGELEVRVVANADLYEPATAALIAEALDATFEAFASTPNCPVSALELLPSPAMAKLLAPPNPTNVEPSQLPGRGASVTSGETERVLIGLLEELLEITGIDAEDNFFALGGDSIISIKWSAQANARGLAMTPPMVFEHMTIGELAAALETGPATGVPTGGVAAVEPEVAAPQQEYQPMSASGLSADALAELTASWNRSSWQS